MQKLRDSGVPERDQAPQHDPGGTAEFDLPNYTHWLNLPDEVRGADFAHWLAVIRPLGDAVGEDSGSPREQARFTHRGRAGGVFHLTLDRDVPAQMIPSHCRPEPTSTRRSAAVTTAAASVSRSGRTPTTVRSRPPRTCGSRCRPAPDCVPMTTVSCPVPAAVEWSEASPFRPFCSGAAG